MRYYDDMDVYRTHEVDCPHCELTNDVYLKTKLGFFCLKIRPQFKHTCLFCKKEFTVEVKEVPYFRYKR